MNERVLKIAKHAGYGNDRWKTTKDFEKFLEEFSNLIVLECVQCCVEELSDPRDTIEMQCALRIRNHFNIK